MGRSYPFFDIIFLLFLTLYILNKYGNWRRQRVAVTLATLVAWYFSIIIIAILPLDVSMTTYYQCLANVNSSLNMTTIDLFNNISTPSHIHKENLAAFTTHFPISFNNKTYKQSREKNLVIKREIINVSLEVPPSHLPIFENISAESIQPIEKMLTSSQNFIKSVTILEEKNQSTPPHMVCEKPWNNIPRSVLPSLWRVVYWTSQVLTWLILPLMQTYSKAGDFTVFGKIKTAIYENLLWYGSYVLIFIVLMVYVAFKPNLHFDVSKILTICSSASNTWGLTLLVLLLGYGLIEVPRSLWRYSFMSGRVKLDRCFYKAALLFPKKAEAEENLEEVLEDVKQLAATVPTHHASRPKVDILIDKIPESYRSKLNLRSASEVADEESRLHRALDIPPNQKAMIKLNKRLIASLTAHYRTQMQWEALMDSIISLEKDLRHISSRRPKSATSSQNGSEVEAGQGNDSRDLAYLIQSLGNGRNVENDLTEISHKGGARWQIALHLTRRRFKIMGIYFRRYVRPWSYRLLALIFGCLSIAVIWSELVLFKRDPALSLFAIFFRLAKEHRHNYIYLQTVSILTITYLSVCAYFPIFKLRLFDFYALIPHHHTDENSLLFSGLLLSRLTSPLCLNFLCLIHMDRYVSLKSASPGSNSRIYETTFIQVMGRMEFLPIIAHGFNVYFPMAIALLCLANYFDLIRKALRAVGYSRATASDFNEYYVNAKAGADHQSVGHTDVLTLVEEGKQLVRRELRNRILKSRESQGNDSGLQQYRHDGLKVRSAGSIISRNSAPNDVHERRPVPESMTDARLTSHSSSREDLLPKLQQRPSEFNSGSLLGKYRAMLGQAVSRAGQATTYKTIKSRVENTFNNGIFSKTSSAPTFGPRLDSEREPITNYGTGMGSSLGKNFQTSTPAPTNLFDDI